MTDRFTIYRHLGVRLRSEVPLHVPEGPPGTAWDIDIRWGPPCPDSAKPPPGEVIAAYEQGDSNWYTVTDTGDGFRARFRECGEFRISADVTLVEVCPDPGGRTELLPILLAGTVSALMLNLRGQSVLHASAVAVDGVALAFVGQSGRGKSTLAALMCVDGADLVTDDVLVFDPGPPVLCLGGASELRLRESAAGIATDLPAASAVTRATADKRLAFAPPVAHDEPLPLGAIVVPAPSRSAESLVVRRVPPSTAVFVLLSFPRIHGWRTPEVLAREFAMTSGLASNVAVYDVTIPWGPPFDPGILRPLRDLVIGANSTA